MTGAILAGAWLRLHQLGVASLWVDEAYTYYFVTGPFRQSWIALLDSGVHPPLFFLFARVFANVTASELGLRMAAALAGVASIPAMYQFGRRWGNQTAGLIGAWMLAVSPFAIWYARDARPNTLSLLVSLITAWHFARLYRRITLPRWLAFTASSALGYLSHYFTSLFALACAIFLIARLNRDAVLFRWWTLAQFGAAALASSWYVIWLLHPVHSLGISWIPRPRMVDLPLTLFNLATGWNERWTASVIVTGMLWALAIVLSLVPAHRRYWRHPRWLGLALIWTVVPISAVYLFSLRRPVYIDRYFIVLLPPLTLLASVGLAAVRQAARSVLTVLLLSSSVATALGLFGSPAYAKEDWRSAAGFLRERQSSGEAFRLLDEENLIPLAYYGVRPAGINATPLPQAFWMVVRDPRESSHRFSEFEDRPTLADLPLAQDWLEQNRYQITAEQHFSGVEVLYVSRVAGSPP